MMFGSLNRRANPFLMKDEELWDTLNFWTENKIGEKKARPGLTQIFNNPDSSEVKAFAYVKFPNGYKRLARFSSNKIYAIDPDVATDWGSADHTLASGNFVRPEHTVLAGKAHIVDRISTTNSPYLHWTNSAGTDSFTATNYVSSGNLVTPYSGAHICTFHRRVYTGDVWDRSTNIYGSRISYSTIDYQDALTSPASPWSIDEDDVSTANFRNIDIDYKGKIIKITNINDRLNIYKEEGIYRYNESQVFDIFGLSPLEGTVSTMEETKQDFFLTNEGFFKTDGKTTTVVGDGWYPYLKEIFANGVDTTKFHSYAVNFLYFCYMGNVTFNGKVIANACFVYNAYYDEMSLWSFAKNITAIGHFVNSSKEKIIIMGDNTGKTYKLDYEASTDDGTPYGGYFQSKYFFYDQPQLQDVITQIAAFGLPGSSVKLLVDKNFENEPKEVGEIKDYFNIIRIDTNIMGYFNTLSYRFIWDGHGARPSIYGVLPNIQVTSERDNESQ